eukprot:c14118_g1_i1.p1 GENE.c14118_g1_i1~~c14118_g1_i1.p1  ORF type:complete len:356 (-),score=141.47 c14118_g1_i1:143-1210(-)
MNWFQLLFGFRESIEAVQKHLVIEGNFIKSLVNHKSYCIGTFQTPSLQELREKSGRIKRQREQTLKVSNIIANVTDLHSQKENKFSVFQVASQFNCLEFISYQICPEDGVTRYQADHTQGPACAISCGAGTVYRNYFVPVPTGVDDDDVIQIGQSSKYQINNLCDFIHHLEIPNSTHPPYFKVVNGYTIAKDETLDALNVRINQLNYDELIRSIRVGVQYDLEVTSTNWGQTILNDPSQLVTQVFVSACSVAYSSGNPRKWKKFASLVLDAAYEATLWIALQNAISHNWSHGSSKVFLTCVGGGVFGNDIDWIIDAMRKSLNKFKDTRLDVYIVSYGSIDPKLISFVEEFSAEHL